MMKKYPICAGSRTNQKPYTGQITEIAPYVRNIYEIPSIINTMIRIRLYIVYSKITIFSKYFLKVEIL